jgi:hypothetical protein
MSELHVTVFWILSELFAGRSNIYCAVGAELAGQQYLHVCQPIYIFNSLTQSTLPVQRTLSLWFKDRMYLWNKV